MKRSAFNRPLFSIRKRPSQATFISVGWLGQLNRARIDDAGRLELHDRRVEAFEIVFLLQRLGRHDHGFRQEDRQRAAETRQVATLEGFHHLDLLLAQHGDMDHLADDDVDRLRRQVFEGVGVDDLDLVAVLVGGHELACLAHHVRVELDAVDLVRRLCREEGHHAGAAAQFQHLGARLDGVEDRRLEAVHAVLVHQHIVMVVDRDELSQIAAFDFAFVQHDVPVVDCMGTLSATGKHFDAPS
jgi:hypothetical protein